MLTLTPFALQNTPALIESVFPVQKVSFEAQRERKAGAGQTLTALGSYWKGRKPLILVRAIVLGCLLPPTHDAEKDLEIYEKLLAFDEAGLAKRALANNAFSPKQILYTLNLTQPWEYFSYKIKIADLNAAQVDLWCAPFDADEQGITVRWKTDLDVSHKLQLYREMLRSLPSYEARAALCKRPEECEQSDLFSEIWSEVNQHYQHLGIKATTHADLVEQLGILRYGHRPKVGDTFCGGGSIPFEAARLGCDVYASDLNPIACMLTWGALNIIGAEPEKRAEIEQAQKLVAAAVDKEITDLGIEHDNQGNRAKAYLYCLETRCPETGWMVPLSPSWIVSLTRNVIAKLIPVPEQKRFDIEIIIGASAAEMQQAELGTIQKGNLIYSLNGKTYQTPIKTLRGDYKDSNGNTLNRLRPWQKQDFKPLLDDVFQERLYCIQWITADSVEKKQQETFFAAVTEDDFLREKQVENIVADNLVIWQQLGFVPDMLIESGYNTDQPIRERGWTHWHHLFNARQLHFFSLFNKYLNDESNNAKPYLALKFATLTDYASRLTRWSVANAHSQGGGREVPTNVFSNQALNTLYNYASRSWASLDSIYSTRLKEYWINTNVVVKTHCAFEVKEMADVFITDPPYADAVHYHEITEYFIAWLRKTPPAPFNEWVWDSRRALAIKGSGDDFRHGMVDAYSAMAKHMPDNGMQCVMFTHQDTSVWSDMVGIFWAAGLQVVGAWYIATETTSELKKGGYVQGTVILMLRKRPAGDNPGFKQRILPAVRREVEVQIKQMLHLNDQVEDKLGEPVFNDSDLQMAGYAAALKVLTGYTAIGGEDVTSFALRPKQKGQVTVVDEIVQQASEAANSLLIPEGLQADTWHAIKGIQRFYLRMLDIETTGAAKLDNYQNFAKAFHVEDYTKIMASMAPNKARLKCVAEFASRDLSESTEIGSTYLGKLIIALQQLLQEKEPQSVLDYLNTDISNFMEARPVLIDMIDFIAAKTKSATVRDAAEILSARLRNQRLA
jgi:adenine-specific DNA methylase